MAAKLTRVEESLLALQQVQIDLMKLAVAHPDAAGSVMALSQAVGEPLAVIRRTLARTSQALRGELND